MTSKNNDEKIDASLPEEKPSFVKSDVSKDLLGAEENNIPENDFHTKNDESDLEKNDFSLEKITQEQLIDEETKVTKDDFDGEQNDELIFEESMFINNYLDENGLSFKTKLNKSFSNLEEDLLIAVEPSKQNEESKSVSDANDFINSVLERNESLLQNANSFDDQVINQACEQNDEQASEIIADNDEKLSDDEVDIAACEAELPIEETYIDKNRIKQSDVTNDDLFFENMFTDGELNDNFIQNDIIADNLDNEALYKEAEPESTIDAIKKFIKLLSPDYWAALFFASFCFASLTSVLKITDNFSSIDSIQLIDVSYFVMSLFISFIALFLIQIILKTKRIIPLSLLIISTILAIVLAFNLSKNIYFVIGLAFVMFLIVAWVAKDDKIGISELKIGKSSVWVFAAFGAIAFTIIISIATISRYNAFMAHNFDFGIFAQMFEKMRITGLPDTTLERNTLMSHFGVHFSPFYYMLLPFYIICPRPETLFVIQAAFIAIGVFPVVLICKKLNLSNIITLGFIGIYLFFPSLSNGVLYDFHENKFLTVLILFTMYFVISKKSSLTFVFAILTLSVKEDAAIYVIAIALFIMFVQKRFLHGAILLAICGGYFLFATNMVAYFGDGVMMGRLSNYIPSGEDGFLAVIKTCMLNIGYFISQIFTAEKILFMVWMFLPLAFAPFMSEKKATLLLLMPMLVVDLMSNWPYQYDIDFQYTYGVAALLIFMSIFAVSSMSQNNRRTVTMLSLVLCIIGCSSLFFPRMKDYVSTATDMQSTKAAYEDLIDSIPKDKSIVADSKLTAHMYDFEDIYMYPVYYDISTEIDYYLLETAAVINNDEGIGDTINAGYELVSTANDISLYKAK